jgi:hypothetical protein
MNHIEAMKLALEGIAETQSLSMAKAYAKDALDVIEQAEQAQPVDRIEFEDNNGAIRKTPKDCQSFGASGVPAAIWCNGIRYTAPPRQPEPLTDEEIERLVDDEDWYNDPHGFARAIEAKLKEKNK